MFCLRWLGAASAALAMAACGVEVEPQGDGEDDAFLVDGKVDGIGIEEGSAAACAVLEVVNTATRATLDHEVGLTSRAADNIYRYRHGRDRLARTNDDEWFGTLRELDEVKWVGPYAFRQLRDYAETEGVSCDEVPVQLLGFNDYHGALEAPSGSSGRIQNGPDRVVNVVDAGGVEFLTTHVRRLRAENPNTVVVAAGDIVGATPLLSALFHDEPSIESMNVLGLEIASIGNHEFDEGLEELWRLQDGGCHPTDGCQDGDDFAGAAFSYLAANATLDATGDTIFPEYTVRTFGNARVAFIGLTLEGTALVTVPSGVEGISFADEADTINALVPQIQARDIETIVVLIHEGGAVSGLYNQCVGMSGPLFEIVSRLDPAVDVVVAGHTNAAHVCQIGDMLVTSAASNGRLITDIDLMIDENGGHVVSRTAQNVIVTRDVERAADQSALIAKYKTLAAPLANRIVATVRGDLTKLANESGESVLGDVIADAQLGATRVNGAVAAFMNPGGIRTDILAASVAGGEQPGEVTYAEAFAVQPFSNTLVTLDVTGAQLYRMLEQQWQLVGGVEKANVLQVSSGFTYRWDASRPIGSRIVAGSVVLDGVAVDPAVTYRITVNSFLGDGGDGFSVLREGVNRVGGGLDVDAFMTWMGAPGFTIPTLGRIQKVAPPPT